MREYPYLIVGGGMTADAAIQGILETDPAASITMIGEELDPPYNRPPLTKGLWKGKPLESVFRKPHSGEVEMVLGRRVVSVDPARRQVTDDEGTATGYKKLLLATGGEPRRLPFGGGLITYFRTLEDYHHLRAQAGEGKRVAVMGGGFIGSELAAALQSTGAQVVIAFPEEGIGARLFPSDLARFLNDYYREKGVEVLPRQLVVAAERRGDRIHVRLREAEGGAERDLEVDAAVAGLGILPRVQLARDAGIQVGEGILVDANLRTSSPDIYAAGDVAEFTSHLLGTRRRVEHEDNSLTMGRIAGRNIAGEPAPYEHEPYFYSDLFDLGYEAVGELDPRLETFADWEDEFRKGVVYYLKGGRVRGVLLWNTWDQVPAARRLIAEPGPLRAEELVRRLPVPAG
jgi:NADPH-dependent 2,4-dienoyl-CoA reductase/sulfur reductase-like enzyme